ncbi:hypothetical protein Fcan01_14904 [Folsomia candida]|uniref:Uncharacterized protein n=1 Tax=Folsomia candida TaxID=158441 RepID=A0A226DYD4_FOLCA|nr:hypothetical protein Fcan01_14904 [Folsomia candida]
MQLHAVDFLRFGLPLGSCLILCGFVETVISLYEACMDVISVFIIHWNTPVVQFMLETPSVLALNVFLFMQIFADILFLWVGAILKGSRLLLISWVVVTISSVVALNVVWFHYVYSEGTDDNQNLTSAVYTVVLYTLFYAYIICVACQCVPHMKENLEELQPIGKGFVRIWKYFAHNAKMGAQLMLTSELILNMYFFLSRKLPPVLFDRSYNGHEDHGVYADNGSYPIILEEMVLRAIRVVVGIAGLVIISKGKQRWVKYWCIPYLLTLFLSFAIFLYLVVDWMAEHEILTYGYLFYFAINIVILVFTICFCYSYPQENSDFAFIAEYS